MSDELVEVLFGQLLQIREDLHRCNGAGQEGNASNDSKEIINHGDQ